ncbi:MAG: chemotaxis protein CheW [Clostridiales bacterium GWB2_37_7]|nr:MAG: chemotaxis protein CheW [Clostridiales bacterium GWB2_37_7]
MAANITNKFVVFKLEDEEYGIDILRVKEIKEMIRITRVPKSPSFVRGVINLRGEVIPVIDLRKKFDMSQNIDTESTRIIIVLVDEITVGLIIDTSSEVLEIDKELIEEPPATIASIDHSYIYGIGKVKERLIILLDVSKIISITA